MIIVTIERPDRNHRKIKYKVWDCRRVSYRARTIQDLMLDVTELPTVKSSPCPPSKKKKDKVWGVQQPVSAPAETSVFVGCGMIHKITYKGKEYDLAKDNAQTEILFRILSTDLALDSL